jgi:23S rRNA (guanosine2251-2'-O)-methyltransferase
MADDVDPAPILEDIIDLADEQKVTIRQVSRGRFESLTRTESAQGVFATAAPLEEVAVEDLVTGSDGDGKPPFLLLLDGITDPGNLGAILRTAEGAGVTGVILPRHRAARVTPTVAKTAAGAIEHLSLAVVPGMAATVKTLAGRGIWVVGLDAGGDTSLYELAVADQPLALVLGAEGTGLSRLVKERCDAVASIPLVGTLGSLNVAAAAAVACFEISRRRSLSG